MDQNHWNTLRKLLKNNKVKPATFKRNHVFRTQLNHILTECASEDLSRTCKQVIVTRCISKKHRFVPLMAAAYLAPFLSGKSMGKDFYSLWNKATKTGGVIFRPDDMYEISRILYIEQGLNLTSAMKSGFKSTLETLSTFSLLKYRKRLRDIINLVHPNPNVSKEFLKYDNNEFIYTLDVIMRGNKLPKYAKILIKKKKK